jgi:hypothetical protein
LNTILNISIEFEWNFRGVCHHFECGSFFAICSLFRIVVVHI